MGSGCGSVGRAVASHTRCLRFESSHRQKIFYILNICLLSTVYWKDENKEKRGRERPIKKPTATRKSWWKLSLYHYDKFGIIVRCLFSVGKRPFCKSKEEFSSLSSNQSVRSNERRKWREFLRTVRPQFQLSLWLAALRQRSRYTIFSIVRSRPLFSLFSSCLQTVNCK